MHLLTRLICAACISWATVLVTIGASNWAECTSIASLPLSLIVSGGTGLIISTTYLLEMSVWDSYITLVASLLVNNICAILVSVLVLTKIGELDSDQFDCDSSLYIIALCHTIVGLILCVVCIFALLRILLEVICTIIAMTTGYTVK